MEVESGSHQGQTILLSACSTSTKPPTIVLSYLWHYNRYSAFTRVNRTHPTLNRREDVRCQKVVATMNAFAMAKWQLSP